MLVMRFNRTGKKDRVSYRVVVQEKTQAPGKRHVEILGSYDPHLKQVVLQKERIQYWLGQGVQASEAVHNLLVREGILEGKKIAKKMPRPEVPEVEPEPEVPAEAEVVEGTVEEAPEASEEAPASEETQETATK